MVERARERPEEQEAGQGPWDESTQDAGREGRQPEPVGEDRHELILQAVAFAAERFLRPGPWHVVLPEVLQRLGSAAGAHRAALYRNDQGTDGTTAMLVREWLAEGIPPTSDAVAAEGVAYAGAGLDRWLELLRTGQLLVANVEDLSATERAPLERAGTGSMAAVPVFAGGQLWGVLGFSHADPARAWTSAEVDELRAAGGILGAAIQREADESALLQSENRYRRLVELSPDAIVVHRLGRVVFANQAAARLVGASGPEDLMDRSVLEFIHPDSRADVLSRLARLQQGYDVPLVGERFLRLDGSPIEVEVAAAPFSLGDDGFVQVVVRDVTDRTHAEEALRRRTASLTALHETSLALMDTRDAEATMHAILERAALLAGASDAYLYLVDQVADRIEVRVGLGIFEEHIGVTLARGEGLAGRVWETGESLVVEDYETWPGRADVFGSDNAFHSTAGVPLASGGEVLGVLGLSHRDPDRRFGEDEIDVLRQFASLASLALENVRLDSAAQRELAERTRAEQQLRAAEAKYRTLVEQIPAITYTAEFGETAPWLYVSPQIEAILGFTPAEWMVSPNLWSRQLHPDDRERILTAEEESLATGQPLITEYRLFAKDGRAVWFRDESVVVHDASGQPLLQGVMFDVTERRRSEEQVREAEERYRTLVEQIPAITYIDELEHRPDGSIAVHTLYASPQIEEFLGITPEEFLEQGTERYASTVHPDDRARVLANDHHHYVTGEPVSQEYRLLPHHGILRWVLEQAVVIRGPDGRPRYSHGLVYDITARKRAEEELERALSIEREATVRLRSIDEMKNTFLHAVSHELRTPLSAVLGLALTLERQELGLSPAERVDLVQRLAANARKLDQLLSDLLDLDRLDRGILEPRRRPTDLAALIRRVVENSDALGHRTVRVDAALVVAAVDGPKVERIVENLVANALRHTPPESTVWVRVRPEVDGALIVVEDDGPGVEPELRRVVFEPFRQGPNRPDHSPGVGIGLSLVARFAELHGGRAWVEERPGGGASFRVFLPATAEEPEARPA